MGKRLTVYTKLPPSGSKATINTEILEAHFAGKSNLEIFKELFTNNIVDHIVTETIRYVKFKNIPGLTLPSEYIKAFIGIILFSGYHQVLSDRQFWSEEEDLGIDIIKNVCSFILRKPCRLTK